MGTRTWVLTLLVLLSLGLSLALWLVLGTQARDVPRQEAPAAGGLASEPGTTQAALARPEKDARDAPVATEAPAVAAVTGPEGALPVRVVDPAGRPLGGIPVAILAAARELPAPMPVAEAQTREPDGLAWLESDLRGKALPEGLRLTVGVRLPLEPRVERDLLGWIPGEPWERGTIELVLPDGAAAWLEPLQVIVVDAQGAPVPGAEVELVGRQRLDPSAENEFGRATTRAPDGVALLSRDRMRDGMRELAMLQVTLDFEVRCRGPFARPPAVAVPGEPSPGPLRIVLPPVASVEARLLRPDGTQVEGGATVSLEWFAQGSEHREGHVNAAVAGGVARFERVGVGLDLRLGGALGDGRARADRLELPGPLRAGETLRVDLSLGPEYPLLTGRLLLPDSSAAADLSFNLAADLADPAPRSPAAGPRRLSWSYQQTDAQGRFSMPWSGATTTSGRQLRIEERGHPQRGTPEDWIPHFAVLPFPALSPDGRRLDLGDVRLAEMPVVVAGRVVDTEGRPVRQAWLSLRYPEGEDQDLRWYNLPVPGVSRVPSRADGTFEVRSLQPLSVLRVSASQNQVGDSATVEVRPGTSDVVLVLEPREDRSTTRGRVSGSVRLDPDIPMLELDLRLQGEGSERSTYVVAGQFTFDDVLPGTHQLVVRTHRSDLLLEEIGDVVVVAGQVTVDPRLQGIDLRGRLDLLRVRLQDAGGAPFARESVWLVAGEESAQLRTDDKGRLMVLVRRQDLSHQLLLEDHRPLDVLPAAEEQVLTPVPR